MPSETASMMAASDWFARKGWKPFPFQRKTWKAYLAGQSGLIHAPTGIGKTYAAWFGPLAEYGLNPEGEQTKTYRAEPLRVIWITPLRALAKDTVRNLEAPIEDLGLPWSVELRTGDVSASVKKRQRTRPPTALVITPESLSLLLTYEDTRERFKNLRCVVVDEWHELLGSKRGVQTELILARLRRWNPDLRVWGLSATLGNTETAMNVLMGRGKPGNGTLIAGLKPKTLRVRSLIPESIERFPWAGHLGLKMLSGVVEAIERKGSTLLFTNTRSQSELWYQAILEARPEWAGELAIHHGSMEGNLRKWVEERIREGKMRCVVCTSTLDLGVDFSPVEQVIQVGGPKGVARLTQRAGRGGHQPGAASEILCVPTHAFELAEFAAAREAVGLGEIEERPPVEKPIDVLAQHLVGMALAGGFLGDEMLTEVRSAHAFRNLTDAEWRTALDFVTRGGPCLRAYPQFQRVTGRDGFYSVESRTVARQHRMSVGTIASDRGMMVQYLRGKRLGTIEESFIARLKPGDRFIFAGRPLELAMVKDMKALVRKAHSANGTVPRWMGGYMPLSSQLASAVRRTLGGAMNGKATGPELSAIRPLLEIQAKWSSIPSGRVLLVESLKSRDGHHLFVYPLEGRMVHEGLATLAAKRLSRIEPRTVGIAVTDYGFELLSAKPFDTAEIALRGLLSLENLLEDILESVNASEMAKRQFRVIARVAGLVFNGYPGQPKTARQLQASSGLLFDVFERYDPGNLLLEQARREVLEQQLEYKRLRAALERIESLPLCVMDIPRLTPFAFPIWAERVRSGVSSESKEDRIRRMAAQLETHGRGNRR